MQILILNQFYPPDVAPTGQVAHGLARFLVARGHGVMALASRHGYAAGAAFPARQVVDGVTVERVRSLPFVPKSHLHKLFSYASFYAATAFRLALLRPRPDVVLALTTPPYIGLLARLLGWCRGWRRIHWVMDLYPDAMVAHDMLGEGLAGRCALAVLRWLTRRELAAAAAVLTLGPDMAARCVQHVRRPDSVVWVPLWAPDDLFAADEEAVHRLRAERGWQGRLVLMYSGNMGLGHRIGEFLAAAAAQQALGCHTSEVGGRSAPGPGADSGELGAESAEPSVERQLPGVGYRTSGADGRLGTAQSDTPTSDPRSPRSAAPDPVRFAFAGGGWRQAEVEAFVRVHPDVPIDVLPYVRAADVAVHLRAADVLLASLEPAWVGCMLPSKLQGMFAAGRPVIFVGPRGCALAQWIEQSGAGWVVSPDDRVALSAAIAAAADPEERRQRGEAAQAYARRHFDRERNCARIVELVECGGHGDG
jgi:glycosyltransferase involved in cell wall biosynthesis